MGTSRLTAERADMLALIQVCSLLAVATAAPQFRAISEVVNSQTGEVIPVDENNQDIAGCLVGPSGERVCPLVAVGSDGRSRVSARGNRGPGLTGSNGNAGPVNAAAETYKKQIEAYTRWAEQQVENAKRQLGTAGK